MTRASRRRDVMKKIVVIGAGSIIFSTTVMNDLLGNRCAQRSSILCW